MYAHLDAKLRCLDVHSQSWSAYLLVEAKFDCLFIMTNYIEFFTSNSIATTHFVHILLAFQIWKSSEKGHPSPLGATLRSLLQAAICMGLYLYLVPFYPLSRFSDPLYQEWGFFKRLSYQYMVPTGPAMDHAGEEIIIISRNNFQ